jgi:hypothetical protein
MAKRRISRFKEKWIVIFPLGNWDLFDTFLGACRIGDPRAKEYA